MWNNRHGTWRQYSELTPVLFLRRRRCHSKSEVLFFLTCSHLRNRGTPLEGDVVLDAKALAIFKGGIARFQQVNGVYEEQVGKDILLGRNRVEKPEF